MKPLKEQDAVWKTATCIALSTFYFAMLAYPFGVTKEGYVLERALIAGVLFLAISVPAWIVNVKREFFATEAVSAAGETERAPAAAAQKMANIGQLAVMNKWLTPEEVKQILYCQEFDKKSFGKVAVKRNFLTMTQVKALIEMQRGQAPAVQPYDS